MLSETCATRQMLAALWGEPEASRMFKHLAMIVQCRLALSK